jgi:hypothetical protein
LHGPRFNLEAIIVKIRRMIPLALAAWLVAGVTAIIGTAAAARSTSPAAHGATVRCSTATLSAWIEKPAGNAGLGSRYYFIRFTNLSPHTCELHGAPGVSAVSLAGVQLGPAAEHPLTRNPTQVLASGGTASALLKSCCPPSGPVASRVWLLRFAYPPNQTAAKIVPFPVYTCSEQLMAVGEVGPNTELEIP